MTIRTFWRLFLKIFGVYLISECLTIIPQFFSTVLSAINEDDIFMKLMWIGGIALTKVLYLMVILVFVFKTDVLIDHLGLDRNFSEERIEVDINPIVVLRIAILIIGGLVMVESIPALFKALFSFYQEKIVFKHYGRSDWIIFYLIKTLIGYLLIANSKSIAEAVNRHAK